MGGWGSGNRHHWWRPPKKTVVEDCLSLDVNRWTRAGILKPGVHLTGSCLCVSRTARHGSVSYEVLTEDLARPRVRLSYTWTLLVTGEKEPLDYAVRLSTTRLGGGGLRWWFHCPLGGESWACGRRVGKLYLPPGGRYFGCRTCHRLTYQSCQESRKDDALDRFLARHTGCDFAVWKRVLNRFGKGW